MKQATVARNQAQEDEDTSVLRVTVSQATPHHLASAASSAQRRPSIPYHTGVEEVRPFGFSLHFNPVPEQTMDIEPGSGGGGM